MNALEIEAKFYVKDLFRIEDRLRDLRAVAVQARLHEANLRFDTDQGDLRSGGRVLRLRRDSQAHLTYKGPSRRTDGVTSREEIEFVVEDFERARQFIEALGYRAMVYYEKYRTTYQSGGTYVMLDELPYGDFVEIEGEQASAIQEMAGKLGLKWGAAITTSYQAMFERVAGTRGLDISQLTFAAFGQARPSAEELSVAPAD